MLRQRSWGMFQLHSTIDVISDAVSAWREGHPDAAGHATRDLHDKARAFIDEILIDFDATVEFSGSDPNDRHVHAAALASGAAVLLTDNGRDFGDPDLLPYEIWTADELFCKVDDDAPHIVLDVTREQNAYWQLCGDAPPPQYL